MNNASNWCQYNLDFFICPVWKGNTVYNESLMFVPDAKTGKIEPAPLLYKPDKVLEIRSSNLTALFIEGKDYVVTDDGRIKLTEQTSLPKWSFDEYYRQVPDTFDIMSVSAKGRHLRYAEGDTITKTQVSVTYTHSDEWNGFIPEYAGSVLKNTVKKLSNKEPVTIVYNGDSVAVGCNASGWLGIAPFVPSWTDMVTQEIEKAYGTSVNSINTAVGGTKADWGLENVQNNIIAYNPDIVVLRFGTNDGTAKVPTQVFSKQIEQIIQRVLKTNPVCEFILVSNLCPNPDAEGWTSTYHTEYESALEKLAEKYSGVVVAKMTTFEKYLLQRKRYWDTTGNNINHLNDFMTRVQASVIAKMLVKNL